MKRRNPLAAAALLAAVCLLTACSSSTSPAPSSSGGGGTTAVKMGLEPWIGYGGWAVAQQQGDFTKHGVAVTQTMFDTDADLNAAFASGKIDVANVATHTAMLMSQSGVDLQMVLVEDTSKTADAILAPSSVTSVKDLKGMKIAYEQGTTSDLLLNYALASAGMSIADVTPVPMAASDAGTALIAKQVGAAVTYEPYITTALGKDSSLARLFTAGEQPGLISDVLVVRKDFLTAHPDAVQDLVDSWGDAITYYKTNTTDARATIAKAVGEDASALSTAFDGVEYWDLARNKSDLQGAYFTTTVPLVLKAAQAAGIITGDVKTDGLLEPKFVTAAS